MSKKNLIERYPNTIAQLFASLALAVSFASLYITWSQIPESTDDIVKIIKNEAEFARTRNLEAIVDLFSDDAVILEAGYSYNYRFGKLRTTRQWRGKKDIRDRYEELNKNVTFIALDHTYIDVKLHPSGGSAIATSSTQGSFRRNDQEVRPINTFDGDRWEFIKVNNKWKISSFSFDRPPISDPFSGHIGSLR